jgi:hypothetical protein
MESRVLAVRLGLRDIAAAALARRDAWLVASFAAPEGNELLIDA